MNSEKEARDTLHRSCVVIIVEIQGTWETIAMRSLLSLTYPLSLQLSARTMSCLDLSVTRYLSPFAFAVGHESCRIKKTDLPHAMTGIWIYLLMLENKGRIETRKGWQRGLENKKMTTQGTGSIIPVT